MALPHYWQPATETAAATAAIAALWGTLSLAMAMEAMEAMEAYNVHNALKRAKNFRFSEHNILRFHGSLPHAGK